jgi:Uncharacterized protein encoded in hypervariable junctions of pilus gene clusters
MSVISYKRYHAKIDFSPEDMLLIGKVLDISDLIIFEADSAKEIMTKFQEIIDDYLAVCEDLGKEPDRPFSGNFNVRVSPEIHREAVIAAAKEGANLNSFVACAIEEKIDADRRYVFIYKNVIAAEEYEARPDAMQKRGELRNVINFGNANSRLQIPS